MAFVRFFEIWYRLTPAPPAFYFLWGIDNGTAKIIDINGFAQLAHLPDYDEARGWLEQKGFKLIDDVIRPKHPDFTGFLAALPKPVTKDGQPVTKSARCLEFCANVYVRPIPHITLFRVFEGQDVDEISLDRRGQDWSETNELFQCGCIRVGDISSSHNAYYMHLWDIRDEEGDRLYLGRFDFEPEYEVDEDDLAEYYGKNDS